nr:GHKL domain-containing protein [Metabacillus kandeliae]
MYTADPSPLLAIPAVLFLGIEYIRLSLSNRLRDLELQAKLFDEERARVNETFRIVRSERHDFLKHISVLHFMLENGENQEAKRYLDQMVDGYKETNLSIKGEKGTVAGVLHQMYQRAQKAGIDLVYDLDVPISSLPISDQQLVALLGNLLSNSLDASEEWQQKRNAKAQISLQFHKRSGLFLLICKNTCLPVPSDLLDSLYVSYGRTTKGGSHDGLGTKIISDTVKKHQGYLDFVYKEEEFTVKIKVPSIQQVRTI